MKEHYFSLLSKFKDATHKIGADMELQLKQLYDFSNKGIQNSNIDVK